MHTNQNRRGFWDSCSASIRSLICAISVFFGSLFPIHAQQIQIVTPQTDRHTVEPPAQVPVWCKSVSGKTALVLTDTEGKINCPFTGTCIIKIQFPGYQLFEDTIVVAASKATQPIIIQLQATEYQVNEQVITGQYSPNNAGNSLYQIKVIDRQRIEAQGANNLRDLLTQELNIRLTQDNILGAGLSLQGIGGQNIKILIDGVPVIGRLDGNIDISQLNLNNIERVEIVEGPMSVNFGTDALGGVINLISRKPTEAAFAANAQAFYETAGHYNFDARIETAFQHNRLQFSGGRYFFDGWSANENIAPNQRFSQWKPKTQLFGGLQYERQINKLKFRYQGNLFDELITNRGVPQITPYAAYAFDETYRTFRNTQGVFLNGIIEKNRYIDLVFSFNDYLRHKQTIRKNLVDLSEIIVDNPEAQNRDGFKHLLARGTYSMNKPETRINYQLGYDLNYETGTGNRMSENGKAQIGDYALFGSVEYRPNARWTLRPGLRWAYNTRYDAPLIPSLHLKFRITEHLSLRTSYARGFRAPGLKELYFFFVDFNHNIRGNPELTAERSHNWNALLQFQHLGKAHLWKAEISGFYNRITDLIQLAIASGAEAAAVPLFTYQNIGKFGTQGGQVSFSIQHNYYTLEAGTNITGRTNLPAETEQHLPKFIYSPEYRIALRLRWPAQSAEIACFAKHTGSSPNYIIDSDNNFRQQQIGAFTMADITASKKLFNKHLRITAGLKNIFNVTNITTGVVGGAHTSGGSSMPMGMGRTGFVSLQWQW